MVEYSDDITLVLKAVSDPVRRNLLEELKSGPKTVTDLAGPFEIGFAAISKHMQYLLKAELVSKRKIGREAVYSLSARPLQSLQSWLEQYQSYWNTKLDVLEGLIKESEDE